VLLRTAASRQELGVNLPQQPGGEGKPLAQARHALLQRGHVVGHLHHIVHRHARCLIEFVEEETRQGRLGPLDLAGEDSLTAHVAVEKQVRIR
jgi:hypothetical protein